MAQLWIHVIAKDVFIWSALQCCCNSNKENAERNALSVGIITLDHMYGAIVKSLKYGGSFGVFFLKSARSLTFAYRMVFEQIEFKTAF